LFTSSSFSASYIPFSSSSGVRALKWQHFKIFRIYYCCIYTMCNEVL